MAVHGTFDNDRPRPVAEKPLEHFPETWTIAAEARAAGAAIGDCVLDLQVLDRSRARIREQAAIGVGAVKESTLVLTGYIGDRIDRGHR